MEIRQSLIDSSRYKLKCPYTMTPVAITVHNTANNATANNEINYMKNNNNEVSFHLAVDDKEAVQGIPFNRNAWHAGDGNGKGNRKTIGLEICYSLSGGNKFIQAEKNAAKVIAQIHKQYGWETLRLYKHQDFNGKYCPHRTLDMGWQRFVDMCQAELDAIYHVEPTPLPQPQPTDLNKYTDVQLATMVWQGVFGNGDARKQQLGSRYKLVQDLVGQYVGQDPKSDVTSKALAKEVWDGLWGDGKTRADALDKAGFDSEKVQYWVNKTAPNEPTPAPKPIKSISVGSKVKVIKPIDWYGRKLNVNGVYDVIQIDGNRVVIGKGKAVTAAIHKDNLKLV